MPGPAEGIRATVRREKEHSTVPAQEVYHLTDNKQSPPPKKNVRRKIK